MNQMTTDWKEDKRWSDKFLHEIKGILGQQLIGEPHVEEDMERNTDLICLKMEPIRIGCRIRKFSYISKYENEFTIRAGRPSGVKTELTKIIEGWGNYLFYGFSNESETRLFSWKIINLNAFRLFFNREMAAKKGAIPGIHKKNVDGSSNFISFDVRLCPDNLIFAKSEATG